MTKIGQHLQCVHHGKAEACLWMLNLLQAIGIQWLKMNMGCYKILYFLCLISSDFQNVAQFRNSFVKLFQAGFKLCYVIFLGQIYCIAIHFDSKVKKIKMNFALITVSQFWCILHWNFYMFSKVLNRNESAAGHQVISLRLALIAFSHLFAIQLSCP